MSPCRLNSRDNSNGLNLIRMVLQRIASRWKQYRYRFVPWLVMNLKERSARKVGDGDQDKVVSDREVSKLLTGFLQTLSDAAKTDANDNIDKVYEDMLKRQCGCPQTAKRNLTVMQNHLGYSIMRKKSKVPGAGTGVIVNKGNVRKGSVVALYPGTIYQVGDPILLQSIRNPFVFRCIDNILIDGNDKGISKFIYKSCCQRDRHGAFFTSDMSWVTANPANPMAVGQYVNNQNKQYPANVAYQEFDVPEDFPLHQRQFIPNVHYAPQGSVQQQRLTRTVALVSLRDIQEGEELFSNYFTVVHNQ